MVEHSQRQLGQKGTKKAFLGEAGAKSEHVQNQGRLRPARTLMGFKETHIYSLKVGAFQIPIKNGQGVSLDQDDEERSGFFLHHSVVKIYRLLLCI